MADGLMSLLVTGGLGATVGGIVTSLVQVFSRRNESRATAADLVTHAAGDLATRQAAVIDRLERQSDKQRRAVLALTNLIEDELLPQLPLPSAERVKLRQALSAVKLAI